MGIPGFDAWLTHDPSQDFNCPFDENCGGCEWNTEDDTCSYEGQDVQLFDVQRCRVCGCTWDNGCLNGCYWVEEDLCSECATVEMLAGLSGWNGITNNK